jgi:YD repeat-containing protein
VLAVSTGSERLAFVYDAQHRIVKAFDTSQHIVEYTYDSAGRLGRAVSDGVTRSYMYGAADELLSISEPGRLIENRFDPAGRLSHQTVYRPNTPDYSEAFTYVVEGGSVVETIVTENDGSHTRYRFDEQHREVLESYDAPGRRPVMVSFDRAPGGFVRALTVRCTKGGRRVSQTVAVRSTDEERIKDAVIREKCE